MAVGRNRLDSAKFPVFSLFNRELAGQNPRDGFAADCPHSQRVCILTVRPSATARSPENPRDFRVFARDMAGRVTGRDGYLP